MAKKKVDTDTMSTDTITPEQMPPEKKKTVQHPRLTALMASEMIKKINKDSGGIIAARATDLDYHTKRIPSGIFKLDCGLGGGWAVGGVHTLYGMESGGKTTNVLRAIAQAQKLCGNCWSGSWSGEEKTSKCDCGDFRQVLASFIDVEGTLDLEWAEQLGVDLNSLQINKPEYAEQSLDLLEGLVRSGQIDIIALDSLAFLTPAKEIEESTAKETMGIQARTIGKGMRKLVSALASQNLMSAKRKPTIFFTNQIRMKIGVMYGSPETTPSGMAPKFIATSEVRCGQGKYEVDTQENGGAGVDKPSRAIMRYKVEKNKSASPKHEGEYEVCLISFENKKLGDVMNEKDVVEYASKLGVLEGSGGHWKFIGRDFKKKEEIEAALMHEPELYSSARKLVLEAFKKL